MPAPTVLPVAPDPGRSPAGAAGRVRVGIDLVEVEAIARSLAEFGDRFARRLFAPGELRDATADGRLDPRALAARFAAKEAVIKAFGLAEAGIGWADIEVRPAPAGAAHRVRLHGRAAERAGRRHEIAARFTEGRGLACAIVVALPAARENHDENEPTP